MNRRLMTAGLMTCLVACSGCTATAPDAETTKAELDRLDRRLSELERRLGTTAADQTDTDSRTPAGPIRSLTLRLGTADDRLRLYWADGQTSDLLCTKEGQNTWGCG